MATTINALARQPTELDYADPTKFKFSITKLPKVEFLLQDMIKFANLPDASILVNLFFQLHSNKFQLWVMTLHLII